MKTIILISFLIPFFSQSQYFDYKFEEGNNYKLAEFRFWKPESNKKYKGVLVLVPGYNYDGRNAISDTLWTKFAKNNNLIIVALHFKDYENLGKPEYRQASKGSGKALLDAIKKYSEISSNRYFEELPLLLFGISAGGQFNYEFVCWKPEKVISFVVNKGGYYDTGIASSRTHNVPGIFFIGENDKYYRNNMIKGIYSANRNLGAKWTLIVEKNTKHEFNNSKKMSLAYFDSILSQRISRNNELIYLDNNKELYGDPNKKIILQNKESENLLVWLPDKNIGNLWLKSLKK